MWAIAKPWRNPLKSRCLKTLHCVLCAFYMKTAKDSKMNAWRAEKKKKKNHELSATQEHGFSTDACVCLFSHTSICRRHFELCVPLTWGWVVAERWGWGGRFPAGYTAEAAGNSLCFILLAAKGSEDGDGVEHDSCLNHIPPPWRGILLFLVVYCAGQGVRHVFVARARSCRGCLGDMYHWSTTQGFLHTGQH